MFRILMSIIFAALLLAIAEGAIKSQVTSPDQAMWNVAGVGVAALIYSSMNSFNALRHSLGQTTHLVYTGLLFSFLPILVAVYAAGMWQFAPTKPTSFQIISIIYGGIAGTIDLILFSWLSFGAIRSSNGAGRLR